MFRKLTVVICPALQWVIMKTIVFLINNDLINCDIELVVDGAIMLTNNHIVDMLNPRVRILSVR